jgi:hypothetical protein
MLVFAMSAFLSEGNWMISHISFFGNSAQWVVHLLINFKTSKKLQNKLRFNEILYVHLTHAVAGSYEHSNTALSSIESGKFPEWVNYCKCLGKIMLHGIS